MDHFAGPFWTRTAPRRERIGERGSLEIQAYDEVCFPGPAAEWVKWDGRAALVGALTMQSPTDADDEVASWIAAGTPPLLRVWQHAGRISGVGLLCRESL